MESAPKTVVVAEYVGIDISKAYFDVALPQAGKYRHLKLGNDDGGFKQLLSELQGGVYQLVMEASGPYYMQLACFLCKHGIAVSVVNPLVVRRFCQMRMTRAKTDKKDAVMLAQYGQSEKPALWQPEPGYVQELKQLEMVKQGLQKTRQQHSRQLEALQEAGKGKGNKQALKSLKKMISQAEKELENVEKQMQLLIREHHQQLLERLNSIPGLGKKSTMLLIVLTGGFTKFAHYKQLISYVGLSPRIYESGTSVKGKARICKMGMSRIRAVLYVCSWSAIKCNKACKELYERLVAKGKAKRLALIAVVNKLLKQAFAVATKDEDYAEYL